MYGLYGSFADLMVNDMLIPYGNEKYTLTPVKAQRILAGYGTHISLEDAEIMLELLRKLCKLSVSETISQIVAGQKEAPEGEIVKP